MDNLSYYPVYNLVTISLGFCEIVKYRSTIETFTQTLQDDVITNSLY